MLPIHRLTPLFCANIALLLLAACNNPTPMPPPVENATDTSALFGEMAIQFATFHPYVPKAELACDTADFHQYFKLGPVGKERSIHQKELRFRVSDLSQIMVNACASSTPPMCPGIVVHFGLHSDSTFAAALEVICLKGNWSTDTCLYSGANTYYLINGGHLTPLLSSAWENDQAKRFREVVVIQHSTGEPFQKFIASTDIRYEVFPYPELQWLIGQNSLSNADSLELQSICSPLQRPTNNIEKNRRQGVCFIPVGANVILDDLQDMTNVFKNKGADLGAACPPYCLKAKFEKQGIPPRSGCE